ncbi:MAG: aromatic ring-hydroxylating dioxygenase subunit alpha [Planctomycetaceae bacterium]|nr:aromatic ring-hydroxylating dioxygenase subunit alpha [Planctomycetaceae bacterium]
MNATVNEIREALTEANNTAIGNGSVMPAAYYTSDEFADLEAEHIFRRDWVCLGRADEVKEPGDFYTTEVIGEQLLVTRAKDGAVRVLSNVCRHRGNIVASGKGKKSRFSCSYHAWTYDSTGQLIAAPLMDDVPGFNKSECKLPSFNVEIWEGFLFVNLDGKAEPIAPRMSELMPFIENYDIADRINGFTEQTTWQTNWKCLAENFMEG